ncbi:hypothetical protein AX16_003904 [Volvariella volvacea WC 439]|nr:hypothetical protein AX16_003904 [Volvariella volvacea WC 439]
MASRLSSIFQRQPSEANGTADDTVPQPILEFRDQIKKTNEFSMNLSTLSALVDALRNTESIDDRKMLLEHALTFVSRLEPGKFRTNIENKIVQLLYNDLTHPAATSVGNKYAWRTADGSYNNIDVPDMGKSGTPYSRSVQQTHPLPMNRLPDPGLIFDTLLKRDKFKQHPAGLNSAFFSFAALVIHTVFRTSHKDVSINDTSSYVDLSPLYGTNQKEQDALRVRDGRGLLYPDVFAEDRLMLLPPAVCVILVLFSRNHNYIARKLLEINERGHFVDPAKLSTTNPADKQKLVEQEEELFQTARLINIAWFGSVVFSDYFSCILGLVRTGNTWVLSPFGEMRTEDHSTFERGKGNVVSVEFNCLYRWHATTSKKDEAWVVDLSNKLFDGKDLEQLTVDDFKTAAKKAIAAQPPITQWTFGGLERQPNGYFKDDDLARILHDATEEPAAAFGARGTPAAMRLHEIMGIEQNRRWGVCSLNEFRRYLGLKAYASFLEWNSDPEIADTAEKLYGNIENLELYVGLQAEEAKPVMEGAGLCPGYTISRAILSDAIALTRGDRFFTHDYTPHNLTAWGFADCQRDPNAFGFGSTLGRLFLRTLPNNFTENSVYTFFPLMLPSEMKTHLTKMGAIDQYSLARPGSTALPEIISDYGRASKILTDKSFTDPYKSRVQRIIHGSGWYTVEDEKIASQVRQALADSADINNIGKFFYETTKKLIDQNSVKLVGKEKKVVDLVKHVLKQVPIHWAAGDIAGISLKTKEDPDGGDFTADELFEMLGDIYSFIYLDVEASSVMILQKKAHEHVHTLLDHIRGRLNSNLARRISIAGVVSAVSSLFSKPKKAEQRALVTKLQEIGRSTDELANTILALLVTSTVELTVAATNVVNTYLGSEHEKTVITLASDPKGNLAPYVLEALRIDPPFRGVYRIPVSAAGASFTAGSRVFVDIAQANRDASQFQQSEQVSLDRKVNTTLEGDGALKYLGKDLTVSILSEILRAVYSYTDIHRAPGQSGKLQRFVDPSRRDLNYAYLDSTQFSAPWPTSLSVKYSLPSK